MQWFNYSLIVNLLCIWKVTFRIFVTYHPYKKSLNLETIRRGAGYFKFLRDVRTRFPLVRILYPSSAPGSQVSVRWSKLCPITTDESDASVMTKFPLSRSFAAPELETFDLELPCCNFGGLLKVKFPFSSSNTQKFWFRNRFFSVCEPNYR